MIICAVVQNTPSINRAIMGSSSVERGEESESPKQGCNCEKPDDKSKCEDCADENQDA